MYTGAVILLGYPTQNLTLPASTNRTLRLANLADAVKVRGLVRENLSGLKTILRWNAEHGEELREAGELARSFGIRLSMHPGQYINPGSPRPDVSGRSLAELRYVAGVFDLLGSPDSVAVVHMGGAYSDKPSSAARFVEALRPETRILRYLALENDERVWTVAEIVQTAHALRIPAITDAFHHGLNPGGLTLNEVLDLSLPTWGARGIRPKLHISSQDPAKRAGAHAYSVNSRDWYALLAALDGREADVMVEAKGKDLALMDIEIG